MGNIGKTAKIKLLVILAPLNGVFGGNFTHYPQEGGYQTHFRPKLEVQNFRPFQGEVLKGPKNDHFWA